MNELKNIFMRFAHVIPILYCTWVYYERYTVHENEIKRLHSLTTTLKTKKKGVEKKLDDIEEYKKNLSQSQARVDEVKNQIEKTQKLLPFDRNDTQILGYFDRELKKINVKNIDLKAGAVIRKDSHDIKNYEIMGTGTYLQSIIFIERLSQTERIINVTSFDFKVNDIEKKSRFQMLDFKVNIQTYAQNPGSRLGR